MSVHVGSPLLAALDRLRSAVLSCAFPLDLPAAAEARHVQQALSDQLSDYILPRLARLDAPLLVVVGGSTGSGKSTLVNSLVGRRVSDPGVLRPTTRSPVLVFNPEDQAWFASQRILPGMSRTTDSSGTGGRAGAGGLRLVADTTVPLGLALLDAPDVDSVVTQNRELAEQLLAAADLWLFVTSAARYADAVPWGFLHMAVERTVAVALVLDRVAEQAIDEISTHLREMLAEHGLGQALFVVPEVRLDDEGLIPLNTVMPLRIWLGNLAADSAARAAVVRMTLQGAIAHLVNRTPSLIAAHQEQLGAIEALRADADRIYRAAGAQVSEGTADGSLLRGEVLARWQEFVGTGELLRSLERRIGVLRDKLSAALRGRPAPEKELSEAVETGIEAMLRAAAESAAERTTAAWRQTSAGTALLDRHKPGLESISAGFRDDASRAIRDWQGFVMQLVRTEGSDKRSVARVLAYGVNGIGVTLMIVVFASTAGVTGAEIGVAGGTAVVGQKLLEAIFGDQAVRSLAAQARENLDSRIENLLGAELRRYLVLLDELGVDPAVPDHVTAATGEATAAIAAGVRMKGIVEAIGSRLAPGPGAGTELATRLAALVEATETGSGRIPESALAPARAVLKRAGQRLEHSTEHTVVALAGSTGSGKSSLFNRLAGEQLAPVGVRRPTTSLPQACIWGPGAEGAGSLLDWLGINQRHVLPSPGANSLAGLILLDLPDHDSTALSHRLEVDRLVELVDLMIWVVDPQKYADAILHRDYLAPLAKHGSVLMFALNHIDELSEAQREACLTDLRRLLAQDGFDKPAILATSATSGMGTDRLVAVLRDRVSKTKAASARLTADVDRAAAGLAEHGFDHPVTVADKPSAGLVDALSAAAGVAAVAAAVASSHELRAREHVGFPLTRWLARLRPDPLRRLHLGDRSGGPRGGSTLAGSEVEAMVTARTSLPAPTPAQRARVDTAVRAEINRATQGLTGAWKSAVAAAGRTSEADLPDALDLAVGKVELPIRESPIWWDFVGWTQKVLLGTAIVGGLWLVVLTALGWLQINAEAPSVGGLPLPTLLLLGGLLLGLIVAAGGRRAARVGGRRRGAWTERALRAAVEDVAARMIVDPMSAELRRCADFTAAVAAARAPARLK